ncbi:hypothetical protein QTQ03_26545 [Micromonospora sp. WMMA1363]|uniref:hypothetical protein n=1 Tax=Micromonospora sp. WMMA1363 TaxID=3053985 RepID=UPI00259CD15D|nr:hypothetical protein [Micromonospora sp. WMMA1363]MDM4720128.1 hypothetical protein [Micromonospora sp. WMMA1363]MDM4721353.1 hypothetical protein [Micromonospora sp. WMMA1363]MDM4722988.1 hypothetical protein [Micromonospora sp. WMMA1363]
MGKSKDEKKAAIQRHRDARRELDRVSRKSRDVTPEYLAANRRVIDAEKNVPWWRR